MAERIIRTSVGVATKKNYIDYAMSVIQERALPDVYDGLKPGQRRILYDSYTLGLTPEKPYKKCARIVGDVLGKFHPHGDQSVYEALVKMAQDFATRYPLIDGHGNFGSIDGDGAAAMRYTEAKLTPYGLALMQDINKNTIDYIPNFDGEEEEPTVLSGLLPNILLNGTTGIAVGMATSMPPHNINDVYNVLNYIIDCAKDGEEPDEDEVIKLMNAPDFPTGANIVNVDSLSEAYKTGKGKVTIRSTINIEEDGSIVVSEIPYKINKAKLIERIDGLSRATKEKDKVKPAVVPEIKEVRDESDRNGIRIVVELKKDANPQLVINNLLKHSDLQSNFSINNTILVEGEPKVLSLLEILNNFLEHSAEVILRRTAFDVKKAEKRINILNGILRCYEGDMLDTVIEIMRYSDDVLKSMTDLGFNKEQVEAIAEIKLRRLNESYKEELTKERDSLDVQLSKWNLILENQNAMLDEMKAEFNELRTKFSDERRTKIINDSAFINKEDLIKDETLIITITNTNLIKSVSENEYNIQKRGGKGSKAATTKDDEIIKYMFTTNSKDTLMFFTNLGRVHLLKAYEIPKTNKNSRGKSIFNFLSLDSENQEHIVNVIAANLNDTNKSLLLATKYGFLKRLPLDKLSTRMSVTKVIQFRNDDSLTAVLLVSENDVVILNTANGMCLTTVVNQSNIRPMGRTAAGVTGMKFKTENDFVVDMSLCNDKTHLFTLTESGLGKKTSLEKYSAQSRGGKGVSSHKITGRTGKVIAATTINDEEDIFIVTEQGLMIRIHSSEISETNKTASGVKLLTLNEGDAIASISVTDHINESNDESEE